MEANYQLIREFLLTMEAEEVPGLPHFEAAFVLLSISLNLHGETIYHMRGGKGKCRDARI